MEIQDFNKCLNMKIFKLKLYVNETKYNHRDLGVREPSVSLINKLSMCLVWNLNC